MSVNTVVTLNEGGTKECKVPVSEIQIPDVFGIFKTLRKSHPEMADRVLEVWDLAHDFKNHIERGKL